MFAQVKAISYHLPEKVVTNEMLVQEFDRLSEAGIFRKTGVKKRHISAPLEIGSDLAYASAEKFFIEHAGIIDKTDIDFLLFCTMGTDHKAPASACILQDRLNLPTNIGALDYNLGCTGFVYGIALAKGLVESGMSKNCLVITAEVPNKVLHPQDAELRSIFGDGAATTLVSSSETKKIGGFVFGTDGSGAENLKVHRSGSREPMTKEWLEEHAEFDGMKWGSATMDGLEIFNFSIRVVPKMVSELLEKESLSMNDIDLFVFHQANEFLLKYLRRKMKIDEDKFFIYLENCGNTIPSTIPIAMKEAENQGKLNSGDKVLIAGFGVGLSWSATILTI